MSAAQPPEPADLRALLAELEHLRAENARLTAGIAHIAQAAENGARQYSGMASETAKQLAATYRAVAAALRSLIGDGGQR